MADSVGRMRCYAVRARLRRTLTSLRAGHPHSFHLPACAQLRYTDLYQSYCKGSLDLCDIEGLQSHFDKHGAAEKRRAQCSSNDVSCYALRNPDLLAGYCAGDPDQCKWEELLRHFAEVGLAEGRAFGCKDDAIRCYAERYPDLRQGLFCNGDVTRCDNHGLWLHWHVAGQREGRVMGCATPPSPPPLTGALAHAGSAPGGCRISTPGVVWVVATPAEMAPLARHLNASECAPNGLFRTYRSSDRAHVLVLTGRGRTRAAAAMAYASTLVDPGGIQRGGVGWLNVGIAGHKTLSAGAVRALLTVYDASMETYSSFSERAVEGVQTALGVSITRPSDMSKIELDAVFDTEAAVRYPPRAPHPLCALSPRTR